MENYKKIIPNADLAKEYIEKNYANLATIILPGVYDLMHSGHAEYLQHGSQKADKTILMLSSDERIEQTKGKQTIVNWHNRAKLLAHFPYIDLICPKNIGVSNLDIFQEYQPNIFYYSTTSGKREFEELQNEIVPKFDYQLQTGKFLNLLYPNGKKLQIHAYDAFMSEQLPKSDNLNEYIEDLKTASDNYNENKFDDPNNNSGSIIRQKIINQYLSKNK